MMKYALPMSGSFSAGPRRVQACITTTAVRARRSKHWDGALFSHERFGLSDQTAADRDADIVRSDLLADVHVGVRSQPARRARAHPKQAAADAHGGNLRAARNR